MPANTYVRPTASAPPASPPLLMPQPPIAPLVPPAHVVDLMTDAGSAVFGARWKAREAKLVECPALSDSMPEFRTTYDIEPHAELLGFDDSAWPEVAATELGAKRGGGMVSFFWFRTTLTMPANAAGFDTAGACGRSDDRRRIGRVRRAVEGEGSGAGRVSGAVGLHA